METLQPIYSNYLNTTDAIRHTSFIADINILGRTIEALQHFYCPDQVHLHKSIVKRCRVIEAILAKCRSIIHHNPMLQESDIDIVENLQELLTYLEPIQLESSNQRDATKAIRATIQIIKRIRLYDPMIQSVYVNQTEFYQTRNTLLEGLASDVCNRADEFQSLCTTAPYDCTPINRFVQLCQQLQSGSYDDDTINRILELMYEEGTNILQLPKIKRMDFGGFLRKINRAQTHKNSKREHRRTKRTQTHKNSKRKHRRTKRIQTHKNSKRKHYRTKRARKYRM